MTKILWQTDSAQRNTSLTSRPIKRTKILDKNIWINVFRTTLKLVFITLSKSFNFFIHCWRRRRIQRIFFLVFENSRSCFGFRQYYANFWTFQNTVLMSEGGLSYSSRDEINIIKIPVQGEITKGSVILRADISFLSHISLSFGQSKKMQCLSRKFVWISFVCWHVWLYSKK